MNMPGFTAEAAIYQKTSVYRLNMAGVLSDSGVMPQIISDTGGGGGGTNCFCLIPFPVFDCHPRLICSATLGCIIEWVCGDSGCWFWVCP
jgi:hypothetical protein